MVFFEVAYHLQGVRIPYGIPRYNYTFLLLNPVSLRQDVDCFLLCGFPVLHQIQTWLRDLHSALFSAALFPPQTKLGIKGKRQLYAVRLHFIAKDSLTSSPVKFRLQNRPPFCAGAGQQRASGQKRVLACIYLFQYFATQNKLQGE